MDYDTCGYHRDVSGDPEGFTTYAANNVYPVCTPIVGASDDFETYGSTGELEVVWDTEGNTDLLTSGGHDTGHFVEMMANNSNQAFLLKRDTAFDVRNPPPPATLNDIALFFWVKNISMESDDYLEIHWRVWNGALPLPDAGDWIPLSRMYGNNLDSSWKEIGIVMPSAAANNEYLQIRFGTQNAELDEGVGIDDVSFKSCPPIREQLKPVQQYVVGGPDDCAPSRAKDAHIHVPWTLNPRVPVDVLDEPVTELLQQPLYDVLRSTETFINLIDARRFLFNPPRPREDQFSLTTFSNTGDLLYDLTLDYEVLKDTLFRGIESDSYTNIGDGMRIGVATLTGGRPDSTHFMVLITDGWPNRYGSSGTSCGSEMPCSEVWPWIDQQIDYAISENVIHRPGDWWDCLLCTNNSRITANIRADR
jgi:hypothetical protein